MRSQPQEENLSQTSRFVSSQPVGDVSAKTNAKIPVRRRSARILNSPNKGTLVVQFQDLTKEQGAESSTLHAGLVKKPDQGPKKFSKCHILKDGKVYVTMSALKADLEHKRKQAEKLQAEKLKIA